MEAVSSHAPRRKYGKLNGRRAQYEPAPVVSDEDPRIVVTDQDEETELNDEDYERLMNSSEEVDYYSILGLPRTPPPTAAELRAAFHSLSLRFHPDKQPPGLRALAQEQYAKIQRAYETLINPAKRVVYDMLGEEGVKAEWGVGGSMGRGGAAERMQVGVKAMSSEEFKQWFLRVMRPNFHGTEEEVLVSCEHPAPDSIEHASIQ